MKPFLSIVCQLLYIFLSLPHPEKHIFSFSKKQSSFYQPTDTLLLNLFFIYWCYPFTSSSLLLGSFLFFFVNWRCQSRAIPLHMCKMHTFALRPLEFFVFQNLCREHCYVNSGLIQHCLRRNNWQAQCIDCNRFSSAKAVLEYKSVKRTI